MSDVAIRAENLGKLYRIGERERYLALRDVLARTLSSPARLFGKKTASSKSDASELWAVKDISFEIRQGEVVGIIGRNGAGKSTLLKILARITKPTRGFAEVHGRMGTLLEVGTGFHPELTGRENVFLSGAILGMRKNEIQRKFDEIVAFSEVERFIDTPLKHYSSGMQMRLAFAVAAHIEPEILLVDEVLAVGDVAFQKKCLGKMSEVSKGGRTILFVSHNMAAVQQLTKTCLLLDRGAVSFQGSTAEASVRYLRGLEGESVATYNVENVRRPYPELSRDVEFIRLRLPGTANNAVKSDEDIRVIIRLRSRRYVHEFRLSFTIFEADGSPVGSGFSEASKKMAAGEVRDVELAIAKHNLAPGRYHLGIATGKGDHLKGHTDFDILLDVCHFEVRPPEGDQGTISAWTSGWGAVRFENVRCCEVESIECGASN